jgi:hypothetical protein
VQEESRAAQRNLRVAGRNQPDASGPGKMYSTTRWGKGRMSEDDHTWTNVSQQDADRPSDALSVRSRCKSHDDEE